MNLKLDSHAEQLRHLLLKYFLPQELFFVGGVVRDALLNHADKSLNTLHRHHDLDFASSLQITDVVKKLQNFLPKENLIVYNSFQSVHFFWQELPVTITSFRTEKYLAGRFPSTVYTSSLALDSARRDFTCNAIYVQLDLNHMHNPQNGVEDIAHKQLVFIGDTLTRIQEDPLRIIRAYRFQFDTELQLSEHTERVLQSQKFLLAQVTHARIDKEISRASHKAKMFLQKFLKIS